MSNRSWNKAPTPEGSPNSSTWKERCEASEAVIEELSARVEEMEGRLSEIAGIAAPDQVDELARIEAKLDQLLEHQASDDGMPHNRE